MLPPGCRSGLPIPEREGGLVAPKSDGGGGEGEPDLQTARDARFSSRVHPNPFSPFSGPQKYDLRVQSHRLSDRRRPRFRAGRDRTTLLQNSHRNGRCRSHHAPASQKNRCSRRLEFLRHLPLLRRRPRRALITLRPAFGFTGQ